MKRTILLTAFLVCVSIVDAQIEKFRVALTNSDAITFDGKAIKKGDYVNADAEIKWPDDSKAAVKLYGSDPRRITLVSWQMKKNKLTSIAAYLSYCNKHERPSCNCGKRRSKITSRNLATREVGDIIIDRDTVSLIDTLFYTLPLGISDNGLFELHIHKGKDTTIIPTNIPVSDFEIVLPRKIIDCEIGVYKMEVWVKDDSKGWNYPLVDGLFLEVLPENIK